MELVPARLDPYRVGAARPTDGVVALTGVVGVVAGVVAGTPGMDAHPVTRYRAETAHPTDLEDKAGRDLNLLKDEAQRIAMLGSWHARHRRAELPLSGRYSLRESRFRTIGPRQ